MDPGTLELRIFTSLIVVLAVAFIALLCDYLKGSNESLRERNIELRIRQEERELRSTITEWQAAAQRWPIRTPIIRTPIKPVESPAYKEPAPQTPAQPEAFAAPLDEITPRDPDLSSSPEAPAPPSSRTVLPPGMQEHAVLARHMAHAGTFSGVVVSIGINDYAAHLEKSGPERMAELMVAVESMVAGLLRAQVDFACRSGDDEFLLIFPNEQGADAQRRLATISERLWNFQLRSSGTPAILFCWGAVEVQAETLADSVASASERMHQTKRNRKAIALQSKPRKLAV